MTNEERRLALYCLKANSNLHGEVCEKCSQYPECDHFIQDNVMEELIEELEQQSCYNPDEWCHDCKEYDNNKHCCPRFNNVIRKTVEKIKQPKMGHWIRKEDEFCWWYECDQCKKRPLHSRLNDKDALSDWCPNCGARMIESR